MFAIATKKINVFFLLAMMMAGSLNGSSHGEIGFKQVDDQAAPTSWSFSTFKNTMTGFIPKKFCTEMSSKVIPVISILVAGAGSFYALSKSDKIEDPKILFGVPAVASAAIGGGLYQWMSGRTSQEQYKNAVNGVKVVENELKPLIDLLNADKENQMDLISGYYNTTDKTSDLFVLDSALADITAKSMFLEKTQNELNALKSSEKQVTVYNTTEGKEELQKISQAVSTLQKKVKELLSVTEKVKYCLRTTSPELSLGLCAQTMQKKIEISQSWGTFGRELLPTIAASINFCTALLLSLPIIAKVMSGK